MTVVTNAVCFDFNGTLSLDEELMYDVLAELFAERGRPLPRATYFEQFVGLGDDEIAMRWLGVDDDEAHAIAHERSRRFRGLPLEGRIPRAAAEAVRVAAARLPVAVVPVALWNVGSDRMRASSQVMLFDNSRPGIHGTLNCVTSSMPRLEKRSSCEGPELATPTCAAISNGMNTSMS